uniref:hypothetical protein n=1 Tax=Flavobacterium sp. TaxID=239 RepID=UPI00374DE160
PSLSNNISANSISIINNNVFVGGFEDNKATYWTNGIPTVLNSESTFSAVRALTTFEGNIYSAGEGSNKLKIWKNNTDTSITTNTLYSDPYDIFVTN